MSKRLQVILDDAEMREIQRTARRRQMTVAEWVRQALRAARRQEPAGDGQKNFRLYEPRCATAFRPATLNRS